MARIWTALVVVLAAACSAGTPAADEPLAQSTVTTAVDPAELKGSGVGGPVDDADETRGRSSVATTTQARRTGVAGTQLTGPIVPDPGPGALFGSTGDFQRGPTSEARFSGMQELMGRRFDIFHGYHYWSEEFPTKAEQSLAADGTILYLSWETEGVQWSSIVDGDYDQLLATRAQSIRSLETTVMLAFQHEPEMHLSKSGTAAEYVAAHRYVHEFFANEGVENVVWVWNVTGAREYFDVYDDIYPGEEFVDWVAWDPYNWFGCREGSVWRTFEEIIDPFYQWAKRRYPKPMMVAEFGVVEHTKADGPSKADWFKHSINAMSARPEIKAYVYFDNGGPRFCDWSLDSSPEAFAAFRRLANHPYLNTRP